LAKKTDTVEPAIFSAPLKGGSDSLTYKSWRGLKVLARAELDVPRLGQAQA
jgi:hypothetical protein